LKPTEIIKWFEQNLQNYNKLSSDTTLFCFLIQLIGVLSKNEECFDELLKNGVLNKYLDPKLTGHSVSAVRCGFLSAAKIFLEHQKGRLWTGERKIWKNSVDLAVNNSSMYVRRQGKALVIIILILSLIKQLSKDLGFLLRNCWTKADLLVIVGSEPLSHTSIIT